MDTLVFWAHTSNFSVVQKYAPFVSNEVIVVARELGNNIPRTKILLKPEVGSRRRNSSATSLSSASATESSMVASRAGCNIGEDMKKVPSIHAGGSASSACGTGITDHSETLFAEHDQHQHQQMSNCIGIEGEENSSGSELLSSSLSSSSLSSSISAIKSAATTSEDAVDAVDPVFLDSTLYDARINTDKEWERQQPQELQQQQQQQQQQEEEEEDVQTSIRSSSNNGGSGYHFPCKNIYMNPAEPVFMGTKQYSELFTFWQVNAR